MARKRVDDAGADLFSFDADVKRTKHTGVFHESLLASRRPKDC